MPKSGIPAALCGLLLLLCAGSAHSATDIYVDQSAGTNSSATTGAAGDPFKSITYAMGIMESQSAPDPWTVHIRAGRYDTDPAKPAAEREIFPITLHDGIHLIGDDGAESCILSGASTPESTASLIQGENCSVTIENLTLEDMNKTGGTKNGGACEFTACEGLIQSCVFQRNQGGGGGGGGPTPTAEPSGFPSRKAASFPFPAIPSPKTSRSAITAAPSISKETTPAISWTTRSLEIPPITMAAPSTPRRPSPAPSPAIRSRTTTPNTETPPDSISRGPSPEPLQTIPSPKTPAITPAVPYCSCPIVPAISPATSFSAIPLANTKQAPSTSSIP